MMNSLLPTVIVNEDDKPVGIIEYMMMQLSSSTSVQTVRFNLSHVFTNEDFRGFDRGEKVPKNPVLRMSDTCSVKL